ncbi:copper-translocating P-type ATPase [Fonsecaea monophora]|uniref:Copper-translocating P-type ATPase n=1 Tax=Fonsecaea monophora TaxID=254056 RepID=A0A177EY12_9EURO|nr:copper-translocating P-type ATPase [Fonsecaea monophora]OAG36933.1 copper-translocating P-type ATPase [Fonsecaea monophora]
MDSTHSDKAGDFSERVEQVNPSETQEIPNNYYKNKLFIGTCGAVAISLVSGTGAFSLAAPVLNSINNDLGPDPNFVWIGLVNTLMLACGYIIVGRLSDLCGRRYFFVGGNTLGLVGAIVCSRASSITNLIGGNVLLGLAASVQTSIPFVMGELVPMKHRFLVTGLFYFFAIPCAVFGPAISYAFIEHTSAGWRWIYYMLIITNGVATTLWAIFYHPPTFVMITRKTKWQMVKDFDYIGFALSIGGILVFLMGLSWGGSVHPWKSGYVIGFIVVGLLSMVAFVVYENVRKLPDPIIPLHLFSNIPWVVNIVINALAASAFYGFSIVVPQMVFGVWTSDQAYGSIVACSSSGGFIMGIILSGLARFLGPLKWQMIVCAVISTALLGSVACATTDNMHTVLGLLITGCVFCGYIEGSTVTTSSLAIRDQSEIGIAVGVGATTRGIGATIATTIYVVTLSNRLATTIPELVPPALSQAGLPKSSITDFMLALQSGSFEQVAGVTPEIIATGVRAYQQAQVEAFRTIFFVSIAFIGSIVILAFFMPDLKSKMSDDVRALLRGKKERERYIEDIEARRQAAEPVGSRGDGQQADDMADEKLGARD